MLCLCPVHAVLFFQCACCITTTESFACTDTACTDTALLHHMCNTSSCCRLERRCNRKGLLHHVCLSDAPAVQPAPTSCGTKAVHGPCPGHAVMSDTCVTLRMARSGSACPRCTAVAYQVSIQLALLQGHADHEYTAIHQALAFVTIFTLCFCLLLSAALHTRVHKPMCHR